MGLLADFEHDLFVSFAHLDDLPLLNDQAGWVTNLVTSLISDVNQHFGSQKIDFAGMHGESAIPQASNLTL